MVQPTHRRAALALAFGTSALAVLAAVVLARDLSQPTYIMPVWVVVVAAICVVSTMSGGGAAVRRGRLTPWLAPVVTAFLALACLEVFTLAIALALILLGLVTVRALRRVSGRIPRVQSVGAPGFLLTVGLVPLLLLIFLGRPVVECSTGGSSNAVPVWAWFGTGSGFNVNVSGSGSGSSDSTVSTGTESIGSTTYSWVCDGSTVAHFTTHR